MKKLTVLLAALLCLTLLGCSKEPQHQHTFGTWRTTTSSTCKKEGIERRTCSECGFEESRAIEKAPHTFLKDSNICKSCKYVNFDDAASVVEMGNTAPYEAGNVANYVWDVKIFDGKLYRGAGDYDKNSGDTPFITFDFETGRWSSVDIATDEAIHRFVEIDGKLYTPGIDSRDSGGWSLGNYYVLEDGKWQKMRNVPNGIHCFDMIGFGGKMYLGVGTETVENTVAVSSDAGKTWSYLPLHNHDGGKFDTSPYEWSRTYAFAEFKDTFYALLQFKKTGATAYDMLVFRYDDGKMVYVAENTINARVSRNYWQSAFEWNGKCFITANGLYAVTDFAKPDTHKKIELPKGEMVSDAILYNNEMYVLSCLFNEDSTIKTVIYKSATGEEGSFTEVASFDYGARPYSFDFDGSYFYVGTGGVLSAEYSGKAGMLLRVKPNV